jgi:BMFP domain-containing protein YqiC
VPTDLAALEARVAALEADRAGHTKEIESRSTPIMAMPAVLTYFRLD